MKFVWSTAAQRSFELLKEASVSPPVLAHLNYSLQFGVYCDASAIGVSAVLAQKGSLIAFTTRILNADERKYLITGVWRRFGI